MLHWGLVIAMGASLATGLRISADAPESIVAKALAPILPQGEIWTVHFVSSLALFLLASVYVVYLLRSGLKRRLSLRRVQVLAMPAAARPKWGAVNLLLYWGLYALLTTLTATGIALYLGYGGWIVAVHAACAIATLGYVVAHLVGHAGYGGLQQLLRVFRPSRLVPNRSTRSRPVLLGIAAGVPVIAGLAALDVGARDKLVVGRASGPVTLDGSMDEAAWKTARPVFVHTMQGVNLGGTGESTVEIRAVRDDAKVYFAFRWNDPTRSYIRLPIVKRADGWHMVGTQADVADVNDFYEDKFAVLFGRSDAFGNGGTTHMGPKPLADKPASVSARGLHYTTDGSILDVWQWKATRGGMRGAVDDMWFGPPIPPTANEAAGQARYQAGYAGDPGTVPYIYNWKVQPPGTGYRGTVEVPYLPKDLAATIKTMGKTPLDPDGMSEEGTRWYMTMDEVVPYSAEADAAIPVGTVLPGIVLKEQYFTGDRGHLRAGSEWKNGYWTLEISRDLRTGSKYDLDFVKGLQHYMWVSVFDHNQTRHTRHMRPVSIELAD